VTPTASGKTLCYNLPGPIPVSNQGAHLRSTRRPDAMGRRTIYRSGHRRLFLRW
jgi:hypothetical protein